MAIAPIDAQRDQGVLKVMNWWHRAAIASDLESLTNLREWRASFDPDRDLLTATARGTQGAYTLVMFQGEGSLLLARDATDLDLSKILREDDVGFKITEVGQSLRAGAVEHRRVLDALAELTTKPITYTQSRDCWHASSGDGVSYLYYRDGTTSIQVTCFPGSDTTPVYAVKAQCSPDAPWRDLTEDVRRSPATHEGVKALLRKPIR